MAPLPLMRLQLPAHWAVCYNSFGDAEMMVVDGRIANDQFYQEDLLWLQSLRSTADVGSPYELDPTGWVIDVGWYPAGDPTGAYTLHAIRLMAEQFYWPLHPPRFRSPTRSLVRAVIEHLLIVLGDRNET